jgi:hypothetical protein
MKDQNLLRGLFLLAFALVFGIGSLRYQVGTLAHAGPGLFPLGVSCIVGFLGLVMILRSRRVPPGLMDFHVKNAVLILASLISFALVSEMVNMTIGILLMVFLATLASKPYSWKRNLVIALVLLLIAYAFHRLLGLNLPLGFPLVYGTLDRIFDALRAYVGSPIYQALVALIKLLRF